MHQNAQSLLTISSGEIITVCVSHSPSPPPIGGRMTMEGEWEDSEKMTGEKNRGRLGCLKTPVFQIPSSHKPPARCVRLNAFLMLRLSAVCLFVSLSLIFISKMSFIFWQTQKCSMGKIKNKKRLATNCSQIPLVETSTCAVQPNMQHSSVWHPLFRTSTAACFLM